jgi:CheY-like chemotaxis protein
METSKIHKTPGGTETILIVEDEEAQLALLKTVFEKRGYRVLIARDGPEALDLYSRHKNEVAIVFCDVALPKLGTATGMVHEQ